MIGFDGFHAHDENKWQIAVRQVVSAASPARFGLDFASVGSNVSWTLFSRDVFKSSFFFGSF